MLNYEEIIQQSQTNVKSLGEKLESLDKLHQDIISLKKTSEEIPGAFHSKFIEISELATVYTNTHNTTTKTYLDGTNSLFTSNLKELSEKSKYLQQEISRLINTDFTVLFQNLQQNFIAQTREDLAVELIKFDHNSVDLQNKINGLQNEVLRLEDIDLNKHFDKLQRTLSDIFGAVNAINLTFTNLIQTLNGIVQNLGTIQNSIDTNHNVTKQLLNDFKKVTQQHLSKQDDEAKRIAGQNENNIQLLTEQNKQIINDIKINKIILIIYFAITVSILCYLLLKHK